MAAVHNSGFDVLDAVWINRPLVISNQSLFKIEDSILGEVRQLKSRGELNRFFDAHKLEGRSRETQKIQSSMFPRSIASSLDMTEISSYEVPQHVRRAHSPAINGVGRWYTDGHVEEGGDVSVSVTAIGKKFFMIANRGAASERLYDVTSTLDSFVSWVLDGPKLACEKNIFYCITKESDMIVQPSLCAHAVLTSSTGPFLVSGWEANDISDPRIKSELIHSYCPGVCNEVLRKGVQLLSPEGLEIALTTDKNTRTEALGQLRSIATRDFKEKPASKRGRPSVSKKQRRLNNLRGVKEHFEARQDQRKGE